MVKVDGGTTNGLLVKYTGLLNRRKAEIMRWNCLI